MAVIAGTRYAFSDASNVRIDMSDTLAMISPFDVPLLTTIGKNSLQTPCTETKHEWLESALRSLDGAIAASGSTLANVTDPVTFNVVAGQGVQLQPNDILLIESEQLRVTIVSTDSITVARGFGGSTPASHADSTAWKIIGRVDVQDAAVPVSRTTTKTPQFNYCQIYNDSVVVTSTMQAIGKYVQKDDLAAQSADALKVAWQTWERSLLYGRKTLAASGIAGSMDGILTRITTNAYAKAGAPLTEEFILQAIQDSWTVGGKISHVFLNAFQKRAANRFLDSMRMTSRTDRTAGVIVDTYTSDFGTVSIVLDRNMPTDTVLLFEKDRIGFGPLTDHALHMVPIPKTTGLKETLQLIGQYTAEIRNENAHAKITGLATS